MFNYYFRCFETGIYKGFWRSESAIILLRQLLPDEFKDKEIIISNIYNDWDIAAARSHRLDSRQVTNGKKLFIKFYSNKRFTCNQLV